MVILKLFLHFLCDFDINIHGLVLHLKLLIYIHLISKVQLGLDFIQATFLIHNHLFTAVPLLGIFLYHLVLVYDL